MKLSRLLPLALLAAAPMLMSSPPPAICQELAPLENEMVLQDYATSADIAPHLEALAKASTPSAAIEAYARGRAAAPDSFELTQAFVHKMVALGAPDLCAEQADEVVQKDPSDGLAWTVRAVGRAGQEDYYGALADIATAARLAPREPFVQRIAGQLLAWYDAKGEPGRLDSNLHQALRDIRRDFANEDAFTQEYRAAKAYFDQAASTPTDQPAQVEPTLPPASTESVTEVPAPSVVYGEPSYTVVTPTYNVYPETYIDTGWYWGPDYDTYRYSSFGAGLYILPHGHYDCWPYYRYPYRYGYRACPPRIGWHGDHDRYPSHSGRHDGIGGPRPTPYGGGPRPTPYTGGTRPTPYADSTQPRRGTRDISPGRDVRSFGERRPDATPGLRAPSGTSRRPTSTPGVRSAPRTTPGSQWSNPAVRPSPSSRSNAPLGGRHRSSVSPRSSSSPRPSAHVRSAPAAPRHSASFGSRGGSPGGSRGGGRGPRGR